jgi:hypothetical protein
VGLRLCFPTPAECFSLIVPPGIMRTLVLWACSKSTPPAVTSPVATTVSEFAVGDTDMNWRCSMPDRTGLALAATSPALLTAVSSASAPRRSSVFYA